MNVERKKNEENDKSRNQKYVIKTSSGIRMTNLHNKNIHHKCISNTSIRQSTSVRKVEYIENWLMELLIRGSITIQLTT